MAKITTEKACEVLVAAFNLKTTHRHLRLGQAIMNMLPDATYRHFTATEHDIFHQRNDVKALETFWSHYVIK